MNVYEKLDLDALSIDKNKFRDKSNTSISLGMNLEESAVDFLKKKFIDEENQEYFKKQFSQAISGDGNELLKMDAVKSSSLCSLLFFYNVGKEKNHILEIEGIKYTKSYFEYKNKVYRNPSNMDVVLTNDNGDILFVECKFSEYLTADSPEISSTYFNDERSKSLMDSLLKENILTPKNSKAYFAMFNGQKIYTTGLKQIVAHYVGINHFIKRDFYKAEYADDRDNIKHIKPKTIRFIEVLFDLGDELKNYKEASDYLIEKIINQNGVFLRSTTYQEILKNNRDYQLDEKVNIFYRYNKK